MKLTVSCVYMLNVEYNLRHVTAFLHDTTDVRVLVNKMVHTQHTYNGRLQMIKHTYVDALRRVAAILQVCSYVLPSVYMFKVISFRRTWNATFMLRKEFFFF